MHKQNRCDKDREFHGTGTEHGGLPVKEIGLVEN